MQREEESIYIERCRLFTQRIRGDRFTETIELNAEFAKTTEPVPFEKRLELSYAPLHEGDVWGGKWESAWVHIRANIPAAWKRKDLALYLNFSGEAMIFDNSGCPVYAVTGGSNINPHYFKEQFILPGEIKKSGKVDLWIELAGNALFGIRQTEDPALKEKNPDGTFTGLVKAMSLALFNTEAWKLWLDFCTIFEVFKTFPKEDYRSRRLLDAMNRAINAYDENPENAADARKVLEPVLHTPAYASALTATTVGHAHIDTGWLWPVRETIRKCARTFSSQIALIEQYPDFVFGSSSPQHYQFVKDHYPLLYKKIKKAVAAGRWELFGGMWVEADCNLISGESMVRQFLHGKNFFMDEFGVDVKNLWIPDVFGYSAALPQIIKKAGCNYFLTQKISWNKTNRFPYHTFLWRGIDGTEILTHFPPADTYNWLGEPQTMNHAQSRYHESVQTGEFLNLMGIGDGGGGPSEEHVEFAQRLADLEGMPHVRFGRADDFFERLNTHRDELPRWNGELYLEMHRGTFTTQARTKKNNRKIEQLLTAVEFLYSALPLAKYPQKELDASWKTLLINQFHDIIPGSSITKVYENTEKEHAEVLRNCMELVARAGRKSADTRTLLNTLSCTYTHPVELPADWAAHSVTANGEELPVQDIHGTPCVLAAIPAGKSLVLKRGTKSKTTAAKRKTPVLENEFIRYRFSTSGELTEIFDKKQQRSLLVPKKTGNALRLYTDRPTCYEAWDIEPFYREQEPQAPRNVKLSAVEAGALGATIEISGKIGEKSSFTQKVFLASNSRRLEFRTTVDWQEARKMLRVSFPVDVFAAEAGFDIQNGFVKRPVYLNTSWDVARFEVIGHRYMDLSERDYGVALLNDCKYGYACAERTLDLCLLRSPKYPDWNADLGEQSFTYALLPHEGDLTHSDVMQEAANLNRAPLALSGKLNLAAPVTIESDGVSLEVVKKAEKENCVVIRLLETHGTDSTARLNFRDSGVRLIETNLMEWTDDGEVPVSGKTAELRFKPFEIRTFKLK